MVKRVAKWFSTKPYTKAMYISAIANIILVAITIVAVWIALRESRLNRKLAERAEVEKVEIQFEGGEMYADDYATRLTIFPKNNMSKADKVIMPSRWPMIVSNNGHNTVSLVSYNAWSRIHGRKRNIDTNILDNKGTRISMPVVLSSGESVRLFLEVPIHIPTFVFELVKDVSEFSGDFATDKLDEYLKNKHGVDFYGNTYRYAKKISGVGDERVAVHIFGYNEDGNLRKDGMQTDQVTIEFKTARDNYFTAKALYYDTPTFKPKQAIYLPRGKSANIKFELEPIDSLPKTEDANAIPHQ